MALAGSTPNPTRRIHQQTWRHVSAHAAQA